MWAAQPPENKYGGAFVSTQHKATDASPLPGVAGPVPSSATSALSPHSPLFWVGALAAVSVGLMAYSTTVRVGPVSASVKAGK